MMKPEIYGLVCLDWNGHEVYTSYLNDKEEAIEKAKRLPSVIRVEVAHSKGPPVWTREDA
jgi:hypothetical protein